MVRAFLRDGVIYTVPTILSRGLGVLLVPLYTRVLSVEDYGSLDLLTTFGALVALTIPLEISQGVARFYAAEGDLNRRRQFASTALWFTVSAFSAFVVISVAFEATLAPLVIGRDGFETIYKLGILSVWLGGINYLLQNQFRWELRSRNYATSSVLSLFATAGLSVFLGYWLELGLLGLLVGINAGSFVGIVYGLGNLRSTFRVEFSVDRLREMLSYSAPLVPSGVFVFLTIYVDRLMISHFLSVTEVGLYGIGFRVASIATLAVVGFQGALTPLVFKHYQEPSTPAKLARIFRLFVASALLMVAGIALSAETIVTVLTTPDFYGGASVATFLLPALFLSQMYIFAPGIAIAKKTHFILAINFVGALIHFALNWLLIPVFGIEGASVARLLGYLLMFGAHMTLSQRLYRVPHDWLSLMTAVLLCAVVVGVLTELPVLAGNPLAGIAGLLALGVAFWRLGLVTSGDLNALSAMLRVAKSKLTSE